MFEYSPKTDEGRGGRENYIMRNLKIYIYSSAKIDRMIKSRRVKLAGHVVRMGKEEAYTWFLWGNLKERVHLGDLGVDGRIILRLIFRNLDVGLRTGSSWLRIGIGSGYL
jgi:hypothetical protein